MYAVSARLWVDVQKVTRAEFERFLLATRAPLRRPSRGAALSGDDPPCTEVSFEEAEAYARWAGKRLPTEVEWAAAAVLGADRLDIGQIWEWTATVHEEAGQVIRGGRWRSAPHEPGGPSHRSFETGPARDVGFRCVADAPR
jgi:formylglycine-generating enzyme required for sulfatase activity